MAADEWRRTCGGAEERPHSYPCLCDAMHYRLQGRCADGGIAPIWVGRVGGETLCTFGMHSNTHQRYAEIVAEGAAKDDSPERTERRRTTDDNGVCPYVG